PARRSVASFAARFPLSALWSRRFVLAGALGFEAGGARLAVGRAGLLLRRAAPLAERSLDGLRIHLDRPLEPRAVIETDAGRGNVAAYLSALTHTNPLGAVEISFHVPFDVHGVRIDVRADLALRADRQGVVFQLNRAVHFTF